METGNKQSSPPAVSVLMGVHNGAQFLNETLKSIAAQTLTDYEFIIVDDASTDQTPALLAAAAEGDSRLVVHRLDTNHGLTKALNIGLSIASGRYVARIDADDICFPERLQVQFEFLEAHGDHVAVGCGYQVIDESGKVRRTVDAPLNDWRISWLSGFNPPAPHPCFFFRRLGMDGKPLLYDPAYRTAQDFDLWSRMIQQGKTAVLADVLLKYRRHDGAITVRKRREQAANCRQIGLGNLRRRLPADTVEALEPLHEVFAYDRAADRETIRAVIQGLDQMLKHDLPRAPSPDDRRWLRRTAAGLLADCLLSRGAALRSPAATMAFILHAYRYLPGLVSVVLRTPGIAMKSLAAVNKFAPGSSTPSSS